MQHVHTLRVKFFKEILGKSQKNYSFQKEVKMRVVFQREAYSFRLKLEPVCSC